MFNTSRAAFIGGILDPVHQRLRDRQKLFHFFLSFPEETVSLESPPPNESGLHNAAAMADLMSRVMPTDNNGDVNCHPALSNAPSNDVSRKKKFFQEKKERL